MTLNFLSYWFAKFHLYSFEFTVESLFKEGLIWQNIKVWDGLARMV